MHVHQQPQATPELELARVAGMLKRMQSHAPYACMA
ncbi:UNVERIFIED_ORG: hypothetical protein M2154_001890 [Enterobacter sp. JUb101]|nr:hypothetical protein [Lelliottia amnigena]